MVTDLAIACRNAISPKPTPAYLTDGSRRVYTTTTDLGTTTFGYSTTSGEVSAITDALNHTTTITTDAVGRTTAGSA